MNQKYKIRLLYLAFLLTISCTPRSIDEDQNIQEVRNIYQYYERVANFKNEKPLKVVLDSAKGLDAKISTEVAYMVHSSVNGKPNVLRRLNQIITSSYYDDLSPISKFYLHYYNGYFLGYFYRPTEAFQQYSAARSIIDEDIEKYALENQELQLLLLRISSFFNIHNDKKRIQNFQAELKRAERLKILPKQVIHSYNLAYLYGDSKQFQKSIHYAKKCLKISPPPAESRVYAATMGVLADGYFGLGQKDSVFWVEDIMKKQYEKGEIDSVIYRQFMTYNMDNAMHLLADEEIQNRMQTLRSIYPNSCDQKYFRSLLNKSKADYHHKKGETKQEKEVRLEAIALLEQCASDDFFTLTELINHYEKLIEIEEDNNNYKNVVQLYNGLDKVNKTNQEKLVNFSELVNYFNDLEVKYVQRELSSQKQKNHIINKVNILYGVLTLLFLISSLYIGRLLFQKIRYQKKLKKSRDQLKLKNETIGEQNTRMIKLVEALQESNENLQNFARIMAHDIKSPIASIKDAIDFIYSKYNDSIQAEDEEVFQYLHQSTSNLNNMINVLLDYSSNNNINRDEEVLISEVIKKVRSSLQSTITSNDAKILYSDELPTIIANQTLIEQLWLNIIGNAIKYHKKGVQPIIEITAKPYTKDYVLIAIKDNGVGIPINQLESIYEPYNSYHNSEEMEGIGIGLAVSKKIVEEFGGEIWAESVEGEGSTFYFTLPIVKRIIVQNVNKN